MVEKMTKIFNLIFLVPNYIKIWKLCSTRQKLLWIATTSDLLVNRQFLKVTIQNWRIKWTICKSNVTLFYSNFNSNYWRKKRFSYKNVGSFRIDDFSGFIFCLDCFPIDKKTEQLSSRTAQATFDWKHSLSSGLRKEDKSIARNNWTCEMIFLMTLKSFFVLKYSDVK